MVEKPYAWLTGAELDDHTKRKHKVIREYFADYLRIRCQHPQQSVFRLAVIDGFSGGGRYKDGEAGSPIIFLEVLKEAVHAFNIERAANGLKAMDLDCLLIFNDAKRDVVEMLKTNIAPLEADIKSTSPRLHVRIEYLNHKFATAYPIIRQQLANSPYQNVIFNLDQCGTSHVDQSTIVDIMRSFASAEIFFTFMISSLIAFLQKRDEERLLRQLQPLGLSKADIGDLGGLKSKREWLGTAERIVFQAYRACAPYVSPFSINNPDGWEYWLIHFANSHRAREAYNNVLHANSTAQAHFGRSGLKMLTYNPEHEGKLYLFTEGGREDARNQLMQDIPARVSLSGDILPVQLFREGIYNETPAHSDDVNFALVENPDLEVITPRGGKRRAAGQIKADDLIKLKPQPSFFPLWQPMKRL